MGNTNGLIGEYISEEKRNYLDLWYQEEKNNKFKNLIYVLYKFDTSNKYWYIIPQANRNSFIECWEKYNMTPNNKKFYKGRLINIINNWINNMKI